MTAKKIVDNHLKAIGIEGIKGPEQELIEAKQDIVDLIQENADLKKEQSDLKALVRRHCLLGLKAHIMRADRSFRTCWHIALKKADQIADFCK